MPKEEFVGASVLPEPRGRRAHILSLDRFRGLAVLLVMLFLFLPRAGVGPFGLAASVGWTGVDGFLVLSDF